MPKANFQVSNFLSSRFFLLACVVVCFASAFFISGKENTDFSSKANRFEKVLDGKEEHATKELNELAEKIKTWSYKELFSEKPGYYESLFEREGLVFLIFENDSLCFWTDNTVAVDNRLSQNNFKDKIVKLPDGWFEVEKLTLANPSSGGLSSGKKEMFALILLKREFAYQNKYLTNEFQEDFNLRADVGIKIDADKIGQQNPKNILSGDVYESEGEYLLTLVFPSASSASTAGFYFTIILNILGLFFTIWFFTFTKIR